MLLGMMFSRKSEKPRCWALAVNPEIACASSAGGIDVHSSSGLEDVDGDQTYYERDGGDDLEVDERLCADASYFADVSHAGDSGYDAGEDDGRERHADELDEAVSERLQGDGVMRSDGSEDDSERDADEDLQPERD